MKQWETNRKFASHRCSSSFQRHNRAQGSSPQGLGLRAHHDTKLTNPHTTNTPAHHTQHANLRDSVSSACISNTPTPALVWDKRKATCLT